MAGSDRRVVSVKEYRVMIFREDQDGRADLYECDTLKQAQEMRNDQGGITVIQKYNGERHKYEDCSG